jgi:cobyric acid synthase CobQ/L-threonine-O-3-phosphate decarboxylase
VATAHGGNLRILAARAGCDPEQLLDFSASVNPLGPPECVRAALSRSFERVIHYPDPESTELVRAIVARHHVAAEQIVVGSGSSELLFALARAVAYDRAIIPVPCYSDYAAAVERAGKEVMTLALDEQDGFRLDWERLEQSIRHTRCAVGNGTLRVPDTSKPPRSLVFLGQPNNPTGMAFDSDQFRAVAARHPETIFVVDEAFADFVAGYVSLMNGTVDNVIVLRSLTKFYAIPGLRLGFAVAEPTLAEQIRQQLTPWSVGVMAEAVGVAVLGDATYARQTVAYVGQQRRQFRSELQKLPGLYVYPGEANFLLVRWDRADVTAPALADRLLQQGIAIRTFPAGQHLDERFFRLAVRTAEENGRLCAALADVLGTRRVPDTKRRTPALMFQGTSSNAGKSVLTAALCRILFQDGVRVAPFKAQNMSLNSFVTRDGHEMGRAQVVQAQACRIEPDVRMNPILLKPNSDTGSQVIVRGRPVGNMRVGEYVRFKPEAVATVRECYDSLAGEFDAVVLEGAGSPGEVNLKSHDIVNMRMAVHAAAPVLVVGDIDRGGVFASFVGTLEVLDLAERRLLAGWIVNRFRGDPSLLGPALDYTLNYTGRPVLGVVPFLPDLGIPQEDSVEFKSGQLDGDHANGEAVEIALIDLPHLSNFTDMDAFRRESDVRLRIVRTPADLRRPDAILIAGSKNTRADLDHLRRSGLAERIIELARDGRTEVVGICGGFQMLGAAIHDPLALESAEGQSPGLGLLPTVTVMAAEKTLIRTTATHVASGLEVAGYEIHHGRTDHGDAAAMFTAADGRVVGAGNAQCRVWGTYLHGVFDADAFRRWFIDHLRVHCGLAPLGRVIAPYTIEPALDRLADVVRRNLDMRAIYRLMGL